MIPAHLLIRPLSYLTLFLAFVPAVVPAAPPTFETETWPTARTLVWAQPGQSGAYGDPANWLENGQPATRPPNREADVVLPSAAQPYLVSAKPNEEVRHATVEANAGIQGRHRTDLQVWGNVWVKDGGRIQFIACRGPKNTFLRIDSAEFPTAENGLTVLGGMAKAPSTKPQSRTRVSHKFEVAKYGDASVELIGNLSVGDEIMIQAGRCIVSGNLRWSGATDKGAIEVFDGATLELQSGSSIAPFINTNGKHVYNVNVYRGGTLQGGSPERPLTADAKVLLGYGRNLKPGETGLYAAKGSVIRVFSSDPQRARLVFTSLTSQPQFHDGDGRLLAAPETAASGSAGIVLQLAGDVQLDGAHFDYVSEGGIRLADTAAREQWKNVSFGSRNASAPDKLFAPMEVDGDIYYHNRNDGQSEFALTTTARKSMADYMKQADPYQLAVQPAAVAIGSDGAKFEKPLSVKFKAPIQVTIGSQLPDAAIHYTVDGTVVTRDSPLYRGPFDVSRTTRLNVRAFAEGKSPSPTLTVTYVFE